MAELNVVSETQKVIIHASDAAVTPIGQFNMMNLSAKANAVSSVNET